MLRNIVIDIEMLLDTRYGVIEKLRPGQAETICSSNEYRFRNHERLWELCGVTKEEWLSVWDNRGASVINNSMMTLLMASIPSFIADLNSVVMGNNPGLSDIRFLINTYPFNLDENVKLALISAITTQFSTTCEVRTIYSDWSNLTPLQCKDKNIIQMFVYDITQYCQRCFPDTTEWSVDNVPTPNESLTIVSPKIIRDFFNDYGEVEALGVELPEGNDGFTITKELFDLLFNYEMISVNHVCAVTRDVIDKLQNGSSNNDNGDKNRDSSNSGDSTDSFNSNLSD